MTHLPSALLSEFCTIVQGGRHRLSGNDFTNDGFPAYGAGGLNGYLPSFEFDRSAVILSSIGARCGKCFIAEGRWSSLANTQVILPDERRADTRFLWYQLNDETRWHRSGSAQPFIKPSDVKNQRVFLPLLPKQGRIAAILDQAESLRVKRAAAVGHVNSLKQALFVQMFGFDGRLVPGSVASCLADVVREDTIVTYGIVQAGEEYPQGVPYIRTGDLVDGRISSKKLRHTDPAIAAKFKRSRVEAGDIVMSIRATVGTTALVPAELDGANLTQGTARISPGARVERDFLINFLRSPVAQEWIAAQVKGATFREITLGRLRELPVPVPPKEAQRQFSKRIALVEQLAQTHIAFADRLDTLFASLQYRAFRGEL